MPFLFALSRALVLCAPMKLCGFQLSGPLNWFLLAAITVCNVTSIVVSTVSFKAGTAGPFVALAVIASLVAVLIILISLFYKYITRNEETSNTKNLVTFGTLWLMGVGLCVALTFHARQDGAKALCKDFAQAPNPCTLANVLLAMAYMSPIFALIGFIIAWNDKLPGAVKVTPRYAPNKAPSSQFAAHIYTLDDETKYTPYPSMAKASSKRSKDSTMGSLEQWSDIPV
ncbi:hypothetical protein HYDPIDRAFT_165041 [Hydnomerulius pinastri MD-312]|nr:hypothetical protein HYDPIDRAFT_165041 [Hydnomerulius pinastri MD-312]